ncbi:MAG: SCO family protein [Flavisolibacter sp.]|nr:SCO family protein [Flavisolibacter sp.]
MSKKALYGLLIALFLPVVCYLIIKSISTHAVAMPRHYIYDTVITKVERGKQVQDTVWHQLPHFSLTNQLGHQVSWKDIGDKVVVADFFFTHCPSICPRMTENMKLLQDHIKSAGRVGNREPDFIHFLSFSVDPERDSVPELKKWADRFQIDPANWWLLTGPKKEIYDLSLEHMKLGLVDGQGIDTNFFHTDYMVLIDKYRNIRGYYHGLDSTAIKKLSEDIIFLWMEKDPKRKGLFAGQLELIFGVLIAAIAGVTLFIYFLRKNER